MAGNKISEEAGPTVCPFMIHYGRIYCLYWQARVVPNPIFHFFLLAMGDGDFKIKKDVKIVL